MAHIVPSPQGASRGVSELRRVLHEQLTTKLDDENHSQGNGSIKRDCPSSRDRHRKLHRRDFGPVSREEQKCEDKVSVRGAA